MLLKKQLLRITDPLRKLGTHPLTNLMEVFLRFGPLSIPAADVVGIIVVVFSLDPTHFAFNYVFGNNNEFSPFHVALFVTRIIHTLTVINLAFSVIVGSVLFSVFLMYLVTCMFFHLKLWVTFHCGILRDKASTGKEQPRLGMNITPTRSRLNNLHREIKILECVTNELANTIAPILVLSAQVILVGCNYATIRLHSVIPMPYFLSIPFCSVIIMAFYFLLMPPASDIHEKSIAFLKQMRIICGDNKYLLRKVKSQRACRINIGQICMIKRSTLTKFIDCTIDLSINSILLGTIR